MSANISGDLEEIYPGVETINQGLAEQSYHIITQKDRQEIGKELEFYQKIYDDALEKMGKANKEIDEIEGFKKNKGTEKKHKIPKLKRQSQNFQKLTQNAESRLEYLESLLDERNKIEDLIKINAVTEQELEQIKQSFNNASEEIDKITPKETRKQSEENAKKIKDLIENKFTKQQGAYRTILERYVNWVRKLAPEDSSKLRKVVEKTLEIGGAVAAVMLVGKFIEGFVDVEGAETGEGIEASA